MLRDQGKCLRMWNFQLIKIMRIRSILAGQTMPLTLSVSHIKGIKVNDYTNYEIVYVLGGSSKGSCIR